MSVEEYGRHFSGYRKPEPGEPSRGFMRRLVFWSVVCAACIGWMLSTWGARTPSATVWPRSWASGSFHSD